VATSLNRRALVYGGALLLSQMLVLGCGGGDPQPQPKPAPAQPAAAQPPSGETITLPSGLQYIELREGTGHTAEHGRRISVHYTGWLLDGTKFDSSVDRGQPFEFVLSKGTVIDGWVEGVQGMRVGGRRQLIIPPDLAYGAEGAPPTIPPYATLVFEVELLAVY